LQDPIRKSGVRHTDEHYFAQAYYLTNSCKILLTVLRIRDVIPDSGSELSPSRIPDPQKTKYSILTPKIAKKWFLSSKKYDPGCSSRIPDPDADFLPSRIPDPGVKKASNPGFRIRNSAVKFKIGKVKQIHNGSGLQPFTMARMGNACGSSIFFNKGSFETHNLPVYTPVIKRIRYLKQ
jgi:hypothetical protein